MGKLTSEAPGPEETPREDDHKNSVPGKGTEETAIITGRVVSTDNADPIASALVIVLKRGITVEDVQEMDAKDIVFTAGEADGFGYFQLTDPVERGQHCSMIAFAVAYTLVTEGSIVLAKEHDLATIDLREIYLASERVIPSDGGRNPRRRTFLPSFHKLLG